MHFHNTHQALAAWATLVAIVLALLQVPACGGTVGETAADLLLPPSQEAQLGEQMEAQVASEFTVHPDPEVQAYVQDLGNQIVAVANNVDPAIQFEFTVLDDDSQSNAFAIPGGHIYVFSGLLLAAEDQAEVIGVMGHEVAHVTERHVAERLTTAFGLELLAQVALGDDPGMITQILASLAGTGAILAFSRDQEREADAVGVGYMVEAGYDPQGLVDFFRKLEQQNPGSPLEFLQSHPSPENRIAELENLIERMGDVPDERNEQEYVAFKNELAD